MQGKPSNGDSLQVFKLKFATSIQTPISMTPRDILRDPSFFPEPSKFSPERWLSNNPDLARIERAYIPYGRGSRICLGIKYVILLNTVL